MVEAFDSLVHGLGPSGYLWLGLAAMVEYLFPPFPGDTISLLGGASVARAERSAGGVVAVLTLGSLLGIAITWRVGRALAGALAGRDEGGRVLGLKVAQVRWAQGAMRERGGAVLLLNRFVPSFRAVVFLAAGASGVSFSRTLLLGGASALAWNGLMVAAGYTLGDNAERIESFFATYRMAALGVLGLLVFGLAGRHLWRRSRRPPAGS